MSVIFQSRCNLNPPPPLQGEDLLPLPLALAADPAALAADADALAILCGLLNKDPEARISLDAAIAHPFFSRLGSGAARLCVPRINFDSLPAFSNPEIAKLEWEAAAQRQRQSRASATQAAISTQQLLASPSSFSDGEADEASPALTAMSAPSRAVSKRGSMLGFLLPEASFSRAPVAQASSVAAQNSVETAAPVSVVAVPLRASPASSRVPEPPTLGTAAGPPANTGVGVAQLPAAAAIREGWLFKRGRTIQSWHRRFFQLCGTSLVYYDCDPRAAPPLSAAAVVAAARAASSGRGDPSARRSSARSMSGGTTFLLSRFSFSRSRSSSSLPAAGMAVDVALASSATPALGCGVASGPPRAAAAPRGSMDLTGPLRVTRVSGGPRRPFRFSVATPARTLQLQADNEADERAWLLTFETLASASLGGRRGSESGLLACS